MHEATISLADSNAVLSLFGPRDQHVRKIRERFNVTITHRDGVVRIAGDEQGVSQATQALEQLKDKVLRRGELADDDVVGAVGRAAGDDALAHAPIDVINIARSVKPRSAGQLAYVQAIRENDLVFAMGPAGTGKTYLAVALAVEALKHQQIRKIVLVRPAVEAGESLGYLPGDLQAKINPYLRPLLDALHEMIDHDQIKRLMEQDAIEIVPLAYMRGRTLNESFIILDEAQNTTVSQMKMFLTRMGAGSKIVVSGDTTQVDLPRTATSGLSDAIMRLRDIERVAVVQLGKADIVRHRLVQAIVRAYDDEAPLDSQKRRRSSSDR